MIPNCNNINETKLFDFLVQQSMPVLETTLLREFFPNIKEGIFKELSLSVVQMHFILYHYLHKLALSLKDSNYHIYIHYIYIYLLKKPDHRFCPYFDNYSKTFCLANKDIKDNFCQFHLNKEKLLLHEQSLIIQGIEDYYLNDSNYFLLEDEYETLINKANQYKKFALINDQLEECFSLLGASKNDTFEQIQVKYKSLAKQYHPDLNPSQKAQYHFRTITNAYEVLKDFYKNIY